MSEPNPHSIGNGRKLGAAIAAALGIRRVINLELRVDMKAQARVTVEKYLTNEELTAVEKVLQQFDLNPVPVPLNEAAPVESM